MMREEPTGLDWLFHEIARRRLMHAAGVWLVVCWFVFQILATVAPYLGVPEWLLRLGIAAPFAGLPIVLGLAWLVGGPTSPDEEAVPPHPGAGTPRGGSDRPPSPSPAPVPPASPAARPAGFSISEAVLLVAMAFAGGALWTYRAFGPESSPPAAAAEIPENVPATALAVLPFENVGGDPSEEYFSHGVAEEIRNALSRLPELSVASRTSSLAWGGTATSVREIAAALGVASVLEGSVHRAGGRIRVVVRLVDARTDRQLWAETFDRALDAGELFAIESEIAHAVARALQVELGTERATGAGGAVPVSLEAHDLYLLGLYHWNRRTGDELERAAGFFRAAAELEPAYALAHAGLANTFVLLPLYAGVPSREAMPRAREAAERALALDPTLAEARVAAAFVSTVHDWRWEEAEAGFRAALEAAPSYATAHEWYGVLLDALGRHREARAAHERALELDPMSPILHAVAGLHHTLTGEYDAAVGRLDRALELQQDFPLALVFLAETHLLAGRTAEAEATLRRWARATGTPEEPWAAVVGGVADPARRPGAVAALEELAGAGAISPYRSAQLLALVGDGDRALAALERALVERDFLLFLVAASPAFASLREDPGYVAVVRRMGLAR